MSNGLTKDSLMFLYQQVKISIFGENDLLNNYEDYREKTYNGSLT